MRKCHFELRLSFADLFFSLPIKLALDLLGFEHLGLIDFELIVGFLAEIVDLILHSDDRFLKLVCLFLASGLVRLVIVIESIQIGGIRLACFD